MRTNFLRKIKRAFLPLVVLVALVLSLAPLLPVLAGNAVLYLSPSGGTRYVGSSFAVSVRINSGSHTTNAYKAVVKFPTALLAATSVSVGGSICTLQISGSPSYSNSSGTVNFECGHPGSFSGSAGIIGTVTFLARAAGTANLTFTSASQVKAADGFGTEVLGSTSGATFDIQPAPVSGPTVSSATHPDPNSWYALKDVSLAWNQPAGSDGFSYLLNQKSGTIPDGVSEGTGKAIGYEGLADGTWYFHIRAHGDGGWGNTTHFRIRIDTTPPDPFEVTSEPPAENIDSAPLIIAHATDRPSGIDHYEISIDGGNFIPVPGMPYQYERIPEGTHTLTVRAVDRAGNYRDSSLVIHVIDVVNPRITQPANGSYLPILEQLVIKGTAPAGLVELYLNGELIAQIESDGNFEFTHSAFLRPGRYKLTAIAVTDRGIVSSPAEVQFTVDPRAVSLFGLNLPGWLVYGLLLGIIILLLILLIRYLRKAAGFDEHVRQDLDRIEEEEKRDFEQAEKEMERAVEGTLAGLTESQVHQLEHELEEKIKESEGEAREKLEGELDRIRRHHPLAGRKFRFPRIKIPRFFLIFWERRKKKKGEKKRGTYRRY